MSVQNAMMQAEAAAATALAAAQEHEAAQMQFQIAESNKRVVEEVLKPITDLLNALNASMSNLDEEGTLQLLEDIGAEGALIAALRSVLSHPTRTGFDEVTMQAAHEVLVAKASAVNIQFEQASSQLRDAAAEALGLWAILDIAEANMKTAQGAAEVAQKNVDTVRAEVARQEEEARLEEARLAEQARIAEQARVEEEARVAEAARIAAEAARAAEVQKAPEVQETVCDMEVDEESRAEPTAAAKVAEDQPSPMETSVLGA